MKHLNRQIIVGVQVLVLGCAAEAGAQAPGERALPSKPDSIVRPQFPSELSVKFRDHLKVRAENGAPVSRGGANLDAVRGVQQRFGLSFERSIKLPQESLDAMEAQGAQMSGRAQPDFGGCMVVTGPAPFLEAAANELLALEEVEWVEFAAINVEPPQACSDIAPETPDYFLGEYQRYHAANPGLHMSCAWTYGGKGQGIRIADCESWYRDLHEDRCAVNGQTQTVTCAQQGDHGSAVLGVIAALDNGYGCTGLAPQAGVWFYSGLDQSSCLSIPSIQKTAISTAIDPLRVDPLRRGDVLLLEMQTFVGGTGLVPVEVDQDFWLLTRNAADRHIIVVAAAGNGGANLDRTDVLAVEIKSWRGFGDRVRLWLRAETGTALGDESIATFDNYWVNGALIDSFTGMTGTVPDPSIWTASGSATDDGDSIIEVNHLRTRAHRSVSGDPPATHWLKHNAEYTIYWATPTIFEIDFIGTSGNADRNASVQIVPFSYVDTGVIRNGDRWSLAVTASDDPGVAGIWIRGNNVSTESPVGMTVRIEVGSDVKVFYDGVPKASGIVDWVDSGAIIVGAGSSDVAHNRLGFSTYGSRVDVQGWGENVFSLGYGTFANLDPGDPDGKQTYTSTFDGTSSASAMVAGAVLALQSLRLAAHPGDPLLPPSPTTPPEKDIRELLIYTGELQGTGEHIGPFPNVAKAMLDPRMDLGPLDSFPNDGYDVPDGCSRLPPDPVVPDLGGTKNRFLSMTIPLQASAAIRVTMVDLQNPQPPNAPCCPPADFSAYESATCTAAGETNGCARWVGKPGTFLEFQDTPSRGNFKAARLRCTPFYYNWSGEGLIHVTGAEIMPSSTYDVQVFAASCSGIEATCANVSAPVRFTTRRSGDVAAAFNPPATTTQPDALDVTMLVNKFQGVPGSPSKVQTQLQPNLPELNGNISALDIVAVVDAVKGMAYPFSGPCACPSAVTCGSTACIGFDGCKLCVGGANDGKLCMVAGDCPSGLCGGATGTLTGMCIKTCNGGANAGDPCIYNPHCPGSTCGSGFCRDRCGRCTPPE